MFRHCIFCSSDLGENEAIEAFPIGKILAFDSWKGRLWVVCPACSRWNLTPLEERWEACEEGERLFRDTRLRVQSENIGLAKLPGGSRLIRVGKALDGELAAWRYGSQLVTRRRQYLLLTAGVAGVGMAVAGGLAAIGAAGMIGSATAILSSRWSRYQAEKVVHRLPPELTGTGQEAVIRRWHVRGAQLREDGGGDLALAIWDVMRKRPEVDRRGRIRYRDPVPLELTGVQARVVLGRSMAHVNQKGASRQRVESAIQILSDAGSAEEYLRKVARQRGVIGRRRFSSRAGSQPPVETVLDESRNLALEMALHEETERRALEGELALLETAWRDAEEIAAIADALPDDPLERLRKQLGV